MGNCRKRYNDGKSSKTKLKYNSNRGVALFQAILISLVVLLSIAGLYSFITRAFRTTTEYKSFITVKEAAVSGVNFVTSMSNIESFLLPESPSDYRKCREFNLDFRIYGRTELGNTRVTVCMINLGNQAGSGITGSSYEQFGGSSNSQKIALKITSVATFPAVNPQQTSRVEAVYYR